MPRAKKKERRRLKRKEKHKQAIRLRNASPYRRIGTAGRVDACLINEDWRDRGQAVICALCTAPGRPPAMGNFYVDLWCAGLKDAWGRLDFTHQDFREMLDEMSRRMELRFVEIDPEDARALLAGSVRFARQNGFRLPARWQRWAALLGGADDWAEADLGPFGVGGKLRWVGPETDLRRRLIGSSVEEFLARRDVEFILGSEGLDELEEGEAREAVEDAAEMLRRNMVDAVRRWCFARGEVPHPRLGEAVDVVLESIFQAEELADDQIGDEAGTRAAAENMSHLLELEPPAEARTLGDALDQAHRFISTFQGPEDLFAAVGLDKADEQD
jgi:hypothetical protein